MLGTPILRRKAVPVTDASRLAQALKRSRLALEPFRRNRMAFVREFAGDLYSDDGARKTVPINLLAVFVRTLRRSIISKNPRFLYSTWDKRAKPSVSILQTWANREVQKMHLGETLARIAVDALFSIGIGKVCLRTPAQSMVEGYTSPTAQPWIASVDLDDFAYDTQARNFREASWIAHRYWCPIDAIRENPQFNRKQRKEVQPQTDNPNNAEGDEKIDRIGKGYYGYSENFEDGAYLWEFYLPRSKRVLTFAEDGVGVSVEGDQPLGDQEWVGPDCGPFHFLKFGDVPGNAMAKAPIMDLYHLHVQTNEAYRKLLRQAARLKKMSLYQQGNDEDALKIKNASDGDMVGVTNPQTVVEHQSGGQSPELSLFADHLKQLFSWAAGGLDLLGGMAPMSGTAKQDEMLAQAGTATVADMQDSMVAFTSAVGDALGWYWWHHPELDMEAEHSLPGLPDFSTVRRLGPQARRQVPWTSIERRIDPYSLRFKTPEQRSKKLVEIVTGLYAPLAQQAVQQGVQLDMNFLFRKVAEYEDEPDLLQALTVAEPPTEDPGRQPEGPGLSAGGGPTSREYVRRNVSIATPQGQNRNAMMQLATGSSPGGNPNE